MSGLLKGLYDCFEEAIPEDILFFETEAQRRQRVSRNREKARLRAAANDYTHRKSNYSHSKKSRSHSRPRRYESPPAANLNTVSQALNKQNTNIDLPQGSRYNPTNKWINNPRKCDLSSSGVKKMSKVLKKSPYTSKSISDFLINLHNALVDCGKFNSDKATKTILKLQAEVIKNEAEEEAEEEYSDKQEEDYEDTSEELLVFPSKNDYDKLLDYIFEAKKTLKICVNSFSSKELWQEIKELLHKGVKVQIITDMNSKDCFKKEGISKREYDTFGKNFTHRKTPRVRGGIMHQKFIIIDNEVVLNGSFNCTSHRDTKNHENIVSSTSKSLIAQFKSQFKKYWKISEVQKVNVNLP